MSALATELEDVNLGDQRLNRRARRLLEHLGSKPTLSIPAACGGWRETRAAYRLFDHDAVTTEAVLAPHIARTVERMGAHPRVLCIEDTSEIDYTGKPSMQGLGPLNLETRQGLYLHPTLALTPERLCLGLLAVHRWVREPGSLGQDKDPGPPGRQGKRALGGRLPAGRRTGRASPQHPPGLCGRPRGRHLRPVRRGPLSRSGRRLAGAWSARPRAG